MNPSHHTNLMKWTAVLGACAAVAATSAQAGGPRRIPDGPASRIARCRRSKARSSRALKQSCTAHCVEAAPIRLASKAARNTVLTVIPQEGTQLAPRTKVLLIVAK